MENIDDFNQNNNRNLDFEKPKRSLGQKIFCFVKWFLIVVLALFVLGVIFRSIQLFRVEKTNKQVEIIHSTKITINDVMGINLPPDPGEEGNKTIEGIDTNRNGIRDDVELAIFREYPNSSKTRAALLQYALVGQMILSQPFVNTSIATEVIREHGRADNCLADALVPRLTPESFREYKDLEKIEMYENFVDELQFNTQARKEKENNFYELVRSFSDLDDYCDIDYGKLLN
jgi:hypothetical protein